MVNDTHTRRRSEKSSDFHELLYTAADFELGERHVIKNENLENARWRTAAILKIDISPSQWKSSDFHEILYTAADFELDERHVIKNKKSCIRQTPSSTELFLVIIIII